MTARPQPVGIDIEDVHLAYGAHAVLRDISLVIRPGEFFALLGPSGSGKSTLLRLIAGFVPAQRGRVRIGERDVAGLPPWKRDVGMVFQNYALWPHLTVEANVAFGLEERRWPRERIAERVREMLALVGLSDFATRRPSQLSGGQQQRVAIARTLAVAPAVLLLDEPLSNLDAKLRAATGIELKRLQRQLDLTTVFVTHDQQEAMTLADRLAVLDQGVIQQVGVPRELFDTPANRFVAEFVGSINLLDARVVSCSGEACTVDIEGVGRQPLPRASIGGAGAGDAMTLAFRPHAVELAGEGPAGGLAFDAEVVAERFLGEFVRYELRAGVASLHADVSHARHGPLLAVGSRQRFGVAHAEIFGLR
jgi:iron(III) transport system ATP-binding protein